MLRVAEDVHTPISSDPIATAAHRGSVRPSVGFTPSEVGPSQAQELVATSTLPKIGVLPPHSR